MSGSIIKYSKKDIFHIW